MNEDKHWLLSLAKSNNGIVLVVKDDNTEARRAAAQDLADEGLIKIFRSGVFELRYRLTPRGAAARARLLN
ncbi:hypothetical protein OV203_37105 [Nannocystis sp. ILAH1]|uniref:hypothetical protein n=1 Tax=Nannocystis sp. ILAH1 TaxID=2996789 RepID=UPI00227005EF|nr:hypothetical protein [Nannocystis sp. ILAH1]MCY0992819.1 hypothetical protein [Nannocystis sp. ILAH1]